MLQPRVLVLELLCPALRLCPRRHGARIGTAHLSVRLPPRLIQLLLALGGDPAPIPLALARLLESRGAARPLPLEPLGSQLLSRTRRLFCHRQAPRLLLLGSALRGELLREPPALAPLRLVGLRRGDGLLQLLLCPRARRGSGEGALPGGGWCQS